MFSDSLRIIIYDLYLDMYIYTQYIHLASITYFFWVAKKEAGFGQ